LPSGGLAAQPFFILLLQGWFPSRDGPWSRWINAAAFALPAADSFGAAPRDVARSPGLWQADLGMSKRIALHERYQLQFRAEAFKLFNRARFGAPDADISAGPGEFGVITQPVNPTPIGMGTLRQIQLALRLES